MECYCSNSCGFEFSVLRSHFLFLFFRRKNLLTGKKQVHVVQHLTSDCAYTRACTHPVESEFANAHTDVQDTCVVYMPAHVLVLFF